MDERNKEINTRLGPSGFIFSKPTCLKPLSLSLKTTVLLALYFSLISYDVDWFHMNENKHKGLFELHTF